MEINLDECPCKAISLFITVGSVSRSPNAEIKFRCVHMQIYFVSNYCRYMAHHENNFLS